MVRSLFRPATGHPREAFRRMIFSIHIPKTAGTSFRNALEARYGDRLALFYGRNDPATHPLLRIARGSLASRIPQLEARGIEVLHGHYHLKLVQSAVTDPSRQLWTWLRDPVERVISHYSYIRERQTKWTFGKDIKSGRMTMLHFAQMQRWRNLQTQYLAGVPLEDFAFVGVTERFELGLGLLFGESAPQLSRRYNATDDKAEADDLLRARLHVYNARDVELYAEALRLVIDQVAATRAIEAPSRPEVAGSGLVRRFLRKVS